jgi:hypothetical protein
MEFNYQNSFDEIPDVYKVFDKFHEVGATLNLIQIIPYEKKKVHCSYGPPFSRPKQHRPSSLLRQGRCCPWRDQVGGDSG